MTIRRRPPPALGVVMPRPRGVFWARTGDGTRERLCEEPGHAVYARMHQREKPGSPGEVVRVRVWACNECWPKESEA